jgi:nitrogen regulatory protein P-II 1
MKQIIAVVKPYLAEKIVEALRRAPLEALVVREVKGHGRQKNYLEAYAQTEYALAFLPKVEIEAWVDDSRAKEVVERITRIARTGRMGDGKVFIVPVSRFEQVTEVAAAPLKNNAAKK